MPSRSPSAPNTPLAVAKITDDFDVLVEFCHFPAEHWIHPRTINPIVRGYLRHRAIADQGPKGAGSRAAGIAMAYKLIDAEQARWREINGPRLVALVRAGAFFHKRQLLERPIDSPPTEPTTAATTGSEVA